MLYAMKDNRQYKITEEEKQKFIDKGYKIAELKNDKLVFEETEKSEELTKLKTEIEALKEENKTLQVEKETLKAEFEEHKKAQEKESKKDNKPKGEGK